MDELTNQPQPAARPEIQVRYQGIVVARRPYDPVFAATLAQRITGWRLDPSPPHYWLDFALSPPLHDRLRYRYSWDGNRNSQAVLTDEPQAHLCQQSRRLRPSTGFPLGKLINSQDDFERSIVILLESPHTFEVDTDMAPCAPANGSTGRQLHRARGTIARMLKTYGVLGHEVPVIICNPVPYPASCRLPLAKHLAHRTWRNEVFEGCIRHHRIADVFRKKLDRYRPLAVINACTGDERGTAKWHVRIELSAFFDALISRPDRYARQGRPGPLALQAHPDVPLGLLFRASNNNAIVHIELPHPSGWHQITLWPW